MKTFSTSGTGNQQTLSEIESNNVPIYDSLADVTADLANLAEGQIVATPDTGDELSQPVDVVEEGNLHAVTSNAVAEETKEQHQVNSTIIKNFLDTTTRGTFTVQKTGWYYLLISNKSNAPATYIFIYKNDSNALNMLSKIAIIGGGYEVRPVYLEKGITYAYTKSSMTTTYIEYACLKQ